MSDRQAATRKWQYGEPAPSRPRLGLVDIVVLLWRAKWLMGLVFLAISAVAIYGAMQLSTSYSASARLLVKLDDFYVYRPLAGGGAPGTALDQDQIIQAELEFLQSPTVFETVIDDIGFAAIYPDIEADRVAEIANDPTARREANDTSAAMAALQLQEDFGASAAPDNPILFTHFEHTDPAMAADLLNRILASYLQYRSDVLTDTSTDGFGLKRREFEAQLSLVQAEVAGFRAAHGVTDLPSERDSLRRRLEAVQIDLTNAKSNARALGTQLTAVRLQLNATPASMDLFTEDASREALVALEIERQDLLSRYQPDSQPVININRQILQLQTFLERRETGAGIVRRGPNPLFQDLEQRLAELEAQSLAANETVGALDREATRLSQRTAELAGLEPTWDGLMRRSSLAESNAIDYAARETEARNRADLAADIAGSVRVLEAARSPVEGSSLKAPVVAVGVVFAGFTALCLGLMFAVTRRGFATPTSAERTLGIPVLAALPPQG
ncbi:MAG: Wzz/FepE/Etk N-terminal domain-containing protein [Pseudomonadota bacterium]